MTAYVPHFSTRKEYKSEWMDIIHRVHQRGYRSKDDLHNLIAVRGSEWKSQDIVSAPGWSLKSMAVYAFLEHMEHEPQRCIAPRGLGWPGNKDGDLLCRIKQVSRKWRSISMSSELWEYLDALIHEFANRLKRIWPSPAPNLPFYCDVIAQIMRDRYLFNTYIGPWTEKDPRPVRDDFSRWIDAEIESHKRLMTGQVPGEIVRLYMQPVICPAEEDQHARTEGGVFAHNHRDILESQRPNIAAESLWESCGNFDVEGSGGILIFSLLERISKQYCHFDWISNNLFIDTEIETDTLLVLPYRIYPFILFMFGSYYIIDPSRRTWCQTKSSSQAIQTWFRAFWKSGENKFFDGNRRYDLRDMPSSFPLSKENLLGS